MPAILLKIPAVQREVSSIASQQLSSKIGAPVEIGNVNVEWLNRLSLKNVTVEDKTGTVLLTANRLTAGFELMPLLKKKFVFTTVRFFGFSINLKKKTPKDPLNLQFIIKAFSNNDSTKKKNNVDLKINTILIRRGNLRYDVLSEPSTPSHFNKNHINIRNLSAKISLKAFRNDTLDASIRKLSLDEASGFQLNRLSFSINSNRDSATLNNLEMRLPRSNISIDHAHIYWQKGPIGESPVFLRLQQSQLCPADLSAFVPVLANFKELVDIKARINGHVDDMQLNDLILKYNNELFLDGNIRMKNVTSSQHLYFEAAVNRFSVTTNGITSILHNIKPNSTLPAFVAKLGTVGFVGKFSGQPKDYNASGKISSDIGDVNVDLNAGNQNGKDDFINGEVSTEAFQLNDLFGENNPYGIASFDVKIDAHRILKGSYSGNVQADLYDFDYKGYRYKNVNLSGDFKKNGYNGKLSLNDPNGTVFAEGLFLNDGNNSRFNFTAEVSHLRPDSLNLSSKYKKSDISFDLAADFTGNNIDNLEGKIAVDNLTFITEPSRFHLDSLLVSAKGNAKDRHLSIRSDVVNGEITGTYSFSTLISDLLNTFHGYLPAVVNPKEKKKSTNDNNFTMLLTINNTEDLCNTLRIPFIVIEPSRVCLDYNSHFNKFRLEAYLPRFQMNGSLFESGYVTSYNPNDNVQLELKAVNYNDKGNKNYLNLKMDAKDNRINSFISWDTNKQHIYKADLSATAVFDKDKNEAGKSYLRTELTLNSTPVIINDTLWTLQPSAITLAEGRVTVDNFSLSHKKEYLHINGNISKEPTDTLILDMKQVELSYIFNILNIPVLQFGGKGTGTFRLTDLGSNMKINTDLEVQNFSFNQAILGRLNLFSEWDNDQKGIMMMGSIYKNDSTWTDVNGYVYPVGKKAGISLYFDAKDLNMAFLKPFTENVVKNLRGQGFGKVHLFGPFSALDVEGDAFIADGGVGIDYLNTYYTFNDSLHLRSGKILAHNILVNDKYGNKGTLNLAVNHNHFRDFSFNVDVQTQHTLVYDETEKHNANIYGPIFATGTASIKGANSLITFDLNMRSDPKTNVTLNYMGNNASSEYNFINFVKKDQSNQTTSDSVVVKKNDSGTEYRLNLLVDITPDAKINFVMDPVAGDKIAGNCNGSLQIQYGTKSDFHMYGNLSILEGIYNFSLQQIIHKDFKIRENSTINFHGDPYEALLNVNAIYNLTANIQDLDQTFAMESARRNVPVNCVLKLDGVLRNPTISFDLELPGSNEELERQVKSLVNTEDMMTKQIVYLLVLNKFYTPDYSENTYRSSEFGAVASAAMSQQLSSILNSLTDKVQLGTNIRTSEEGIQDTEVEMLLTSQLLDNRLIFNGNFGYKNRSSLAQKNAFIGEFDLEYKLTRNGDFRLKAYNHANEMYMYLRQAMTTQGVGIMYKKDFTRLSDIFHRRNLLLLALPSDSTNRKKNEAEVIK